MPDICDGIGILVPEVAVLVVINSIVVVELDLDLVAVIFALWHMQISQRPKQHKLSTAKCQKVLPVKRNVFAVHIAIPLVILDEIQLTRYTAKPC